FCWTWGDFPRWIPPNPRRPPRGAGNRRPGSAAKGAAIGRRHRRNPMTVRSPRAVAVLALALLAGCRSPEARLYEGMGAHTRAITTDSAEAQAYFNQGLQLTYGFNHDEAIRSFLAAAKRDPLAPMPWWGVAYCHGININDPAMTE